ncbi:MAG TPA: MFS transporter [Aquella sp.]|nr:MFS transporter [Aquella sp.]
MRQIFNIANYKDRNYTLLLISLALCFASFQTVLIPSLDYIALSIKNNNHTFYNYATVAALATSLPAACSLLAGYLVNNLTYKTLINLICGVVTFFYVLTFFYHQNFVMYAIFVICCGLLFNALFFGLDRQIVTLLTDKIREFQNDMFILGGILAIINYKISGYLFLHFGLYGIAGYCLVLNIIIYICLNAINIDPNVIQNQVPKASLPNIKNLFKTLLKHRKLIVFMGIMLTIMFTSSGLTLLLTTKIHHENLPTTLWSSNMAFMALGGLLGAMVCKLRVWQNINGILILCVAEVLFGICLFGISWIHSANGLLAILWFCGFLNPFILINMNTIFFKYVSNNSDLISISPVVNGLTTSAFYVLCLIGPMILNRLLQFGIDYKILLITCGMLEILLAVILVNIKSLRTDFS